ncbi:hypothetical protein Ancab_003305 [Ancistrocladus abbreviatus]
MKARTLLKRIMATISGKTNELRIRVTIFFLLRNKTMLMDSLSDKLQALTGGGPHHHRHRHHHHRKKDDDNVNEQETNAMLMHAAVAKKFISAEAEAEAVVLERASNDFDRVGGEVSEEGIYPDLTHTLFQGSKLDMELTKEVDGRSNSRLGQLSIPEEYGSSSSSDEGEKVRPEDIDQAAELFIERVRYQIRLENQESFDSYRQKM